MEYVQSDDGWTVVGGCGAGRREAQITQFTRNICVNILLRFRINGRFIQIGIRNSIIIEESIPENALH